MVRTFPQALIGLLVLGLLVQVVATFGPWPQTLMDSTPMDTLYNGILLGAALVCGLRALAPGRERVAWALIAVGLAVYAGGNVYWSLVLAELDDPPFPSPADALWLGAYLFFYVGIVLLARARMPRLGARLWLDGLIAALTVAAISAAVVFKAVRESTGGDAADIWTNLAYPLVDMVLFGLVVGILAAGRRRLDRTWIVLGVGFGLFGVCDSIYLYQVAKGTYATGTPLDLGWIVGALIVSLAAWQPARRETGPTDDVPSIALPIVLSLGSLALLVQDHGSSTETLAVALAAASMLAVICRLAVTHHQSRENLSLSRHQARTDSLTGLGNRLKLLRDLDVVLSDDEGPRPHVLLLFDLDGFKHYNDSYGHPAGDALLHQLGTQLQAAVAGEAAAYRMGGDEFCVLAPWDSGRPVDELVDRTRIALSTHGDGFKIGASCGYSRIPADAVEASEALRVADRGLYAEKNSGRISALAQSKNVLLRAVGEWDAGLSAHGEAVAALAAGTARELGLDDEEIERIATAAELHDIGKIAIPRALLHKPGTLDDAEWEFVRRHTLIGERIVSGAPALVGVSRLIRSSHERWDGRGYPDALAGDEIPLGSQIVFVCDAYSAMTSVRPYAPARNDEDAIAELRRNAGSQFSPAVVEAFLRAVAQEQVPAGLMHG
ncbi:MAG TPA: HD domain-containing phosphohydrolase [Solirubrobacteraceae bacterium]|nr:HD domain-containing phosphohydrolase [Solirubrobacteraceae bacterium]